jgi:hypothetical protein
MLKYGINPFIDVRNLAWAPNWGHSTQYVRDVVAALKEVDAEIEAAKLTKEEGAARIALTLKKLADDYIKGERWPRKVKK